LHASRHANSLLLELFLFPSNCPPILVELHTDPRTVRPRSKNEQFGFSSQQLLCNQFPKNVLSKKSGCYCCVKIFANIIVEFTCKDCFVLSSVMLKLIIVLE
jgi:hypothetical protein